MDLVVQHMWLQEAIVARHKRRACGTAKKGCYGMKCSALQRLSESVYEQAGEMIWDEGDDHVDQLGSWGALCGPEPVPTMADTRAGP